jgi:hypothetical protein
MWACRSRDARTHGVRESQARLRDRWLTDHGDREPWDRSLTNPPPEVIAQTERQAIWVVEPALDP